jgi:inositol polyphosphate 5-phosphatase INPP5B/F
MVRVGRRTCTQLLFNCISLTLGHFFFILNYTYHSDLNYRIDESMPTEKVLHLAERNALGDLLHLDQLNIERKAGRVFQEFDEGPIQFPPTYKYQPGTDVYDTRPEKKIRAPAWCDRILWRTADDASQVHLFSYNRSEKPNCSDHKAVYSTMQITVKDVIPQKREAIHDELMKLLDRFENQSSPKIGLDKISVNFGSVRFEECITIPIQITNTGSVVAQYRFVPKPDEVGICKPWLQVSPMFGMIIPGEQPLNINISITVGKEIAQSLNSGRELLEDILILRLENGRDYYLTVHAEYARSCFGMSLDELVLYNEAIRTVPVDPIERAKKVESMQNAGGTALCVPKELWRILDAIYEKGLVAPQLFVEPGRPDEVQQIRESLDTGGPFQQQYSIHSYTDVLISFLASLATPVIPPLLAPAMEIDEQNIQMFARRLLEELPPIHYNVFVYIISFFREVLNVSDQNLLTSTKVARIATSCLMSIGISDNDNSNTAVQKRTAMTLILVHLLETSSI